MPLRNCLRKQTNYEGQGEFSKKEEKPWQSVKSVSCSSIGYRW